MNRLLHTVVFFPLILLSACATGTVVSKSPEAKSPIPSGKSRIVVYRTQIVGMAVQPSVKVDGQKTGLCSPNGLFYVYVTPGVHEVSATTETTDTATVETRAGQTTYIECSVTTGIFVGRPSIIEVTESRAKPKISGLSFTGQY
ncbi:DUF2846 domain-containing protein [Hoeflea sp. WL0058]|uniref:DUF2846 domain-containing protein n=1 Tax=Flavimaribacter sediminis TaxID=2865987 RepID=A0AAE2ZT98_9HYPH|nr:DUF2846 domain-containing protein [Flavimaribacter sediminis]MBW8639152.1 DUF2846 domain-containing protein [Flavimaribacter sediminis]